MVHTFSQYPIPINGSGVKRHADGERKVSCARYLNSGERKILRKCVQELLIMMHGMYTFINNISALYKART